MLAVRNPVMGWKTRPRAYSAASIWSSSRTAGVIQPPQTLSRGKARRSRMATLRPESRKAQAQDEPAGPAPKTRMSHASILTSFSPGSVATAPDLGGPGERHAPGVRRSGARLDFLFPRLY